MARSIPGLTVVVWLLFCVGVFSGPHPNAQWVVEDDGCRTPDRGVGNCVPVKDCPPIVNFLRTAKKPFSQEVIKKLNDYTCGYDGSVKVCCPDGPVDFGGVGTRPVQEEQPPDISRHPNFKLLPTDCGYLDTIDRIINGEDAGLLEFPWMALLSYTTSRGPSFKCGGTILNSKFILTAAHCITNLKEPLLGVRVGEHNIPKDVDCEKLENGKTKCAPPVQDVSIEQIIPHSRYNASAFTNDIGLLRVSEIDLSKENARPVCLPIEDQRTATFKNVIVTGWGITGKGTSSDILQKVSLPIVPRAECQRTYDQHKIQLSHKQACAGGSKRKDSCPGDSGGPMQVAAYVNGESRYVQQGVVSFGPRFCGLDGYPGVYTRIAYYMDWILDTIGT